MWHLLSPSKLIMPKKLNVAAGSSGILKWHHIVRDVYYSLTMCSTVEKTLCPFHYLDIKANNFRSTGIFPFWPVVFRDHDFAMNHKDIQSTLQFNKNRHTYLLHQLTYSSSRFLKPQSIWPQLPANVLLAWWPDLRTDSALRICLRKLLGRTVDRLLQIEGHGKRKRK